jgi:hypothetical protein
MHYCPELVDCERTHIEQISKMYIEGVVMKNVDTTVGYIFIKAARLNSVQPWCLY